MKRDCALRLAGIAASIALSVPGLAMAAPVYVSGLGVAGWMSGDTRPAAGGAANAAQIAAQIKFLGEGVVVNDAAGAAPDASPTGSLGGLGYVRLDGTSANAGKSDVGVVDANGHAAASSLRDFSAQFRYYRDPNSTSRTPGFAIGVSDGVANYYSFVYVDTTLGDNTWLTADVDESDLFYLYGNTGLGAAPGGAAQKTMAGWFADATFGALFGNDFDVVRLGFNIGSSQRNALVYVDWLETNLYNGGDKVDFVSSDYVASVPEPGTLALAGLALAGLGLGGRRRRRS